MIKRALLMLLGMTFVGCGGVKNARDKSRGWSESKHSTASDDATVPEKKPAQTFLPLRAATSTKVKDLVTGDVALNRIVTSATQASVLIISIQYDATLTQSHLIFPRRCRVKSEENASCCWSRASRHLLATLKSSEPLGRTKS